MWLAYINVGFSERNYNNYGYKVLAGEPARLSLFN